MKMVLRLRTQGGGHRVDNYYIANHIRALGEVGDLPAPYDLYHVNVAFEYAAKLNPFKPEPPGCVTLRRAPLQVLYYMHGSANTEFIVLDDDTIIPHHTIIVTPVLVDITVFAGREVRFISKFEALARLP